MTRMDEMNEPRQFATTQWSIVDAARLDQTSVSRGRKALEQLCRAYWYPLYAFVRSRGYSADNAQDLTQAFFTRIIETGGFTSVERQRGRFRSYLLGAMKHFLANEWNKSQTQKRGGSVEIIEWDGAEMESRYAGSMGLSDNPDFLFDLEWAMETIACALKTVREEMAEAGKEKQFEVLKGCLTGEEGLSRQEMAETLGMNETAVKVAIHRLRQRYRNVLRDIIAETVCSEEELEDELRYLVEVLRKR